MNCFGIPKALLPFMFLSVIPCGVVSAQELNSTSSEPAASVEKEVSDASPSSVENEKKEENVDCKDLDCKNLGSFTVNLTVKKMTSHCGIFKDKDGKICVKNIDGTNDDKNKISEIINYRSSCEVILDFCPNGDNSELVFGAQPENINEIQNEQATESELSKPVVEKEETVSAEAKSTEK